MPSNGGKLLVLTRIADCWTAPAEFWRETLASNIIAEDTPLPTHIL